MLNIEVTAQDTALDLALAYLEHGYSPVPLLRHNKVPPKELGGWQQFKEQPPSEEQITRWFKGRDDLVVALICGKFIVVDADTPEAVNWAEENNLTRHVRLLLVRVCTITIITQKTILLM